MLESITMIEDFIYCRYDHHNIKLENLEMYKEELSSELKILDNIFNRLKNELHELISNNISYSTFVPKFQFLQKIIIELLYFSEDVALLFNYKIDEENVLRKETMRRLENFMYYIEKYYLQYLDCNQLCSKQTRSEYSKIIIKSTKGITTTINHHPFKFHYNQLIHKICTSSIHVVKNKKSNLSLLVQYSKFMKELFDLINSNTINHENIRDFLIKKNFIDDFFFEILQLEIKEICDLKREGKVNLFICKKILKKTNQFIVDKDEFLFNSSVCVKDLIASYINEEIKFMEYNLAARGNLENPLVFNKEPKFNFNFSVENIALLLRLLVECNVLKIENRKEFFQFMAKYFSSSNQEEMSWKSLSAKFYSIGINAFKNINLLISDMKFHAKNLSQ